jgi:hypothetical protein
MFAAKYSEKRVSRNSASPIESDAGVASASVGKFGACDDPHPAIVATIPVASTAPHQAPQKIFRVFVITIPCSLLPVACS